MKLIKIILGSVRDGRAGAKITEWVLARAEEYTGDLKFEFIDLKDVELPFMNEPIPPMMGAEYKYEHTKRWSKMIGEADGFIFITPEYNHGYSGVLKNAIDYLYSEWKDKYVGFIGYGGTGANNAIRQLKEVFEVIELKTIEKQVGIEKIWEAFDDNGKLKQENIIGDINSLFEDLESKLK